MIRSPLAAILALPALVSVALAPLATAQGSYLPVVSSGPDLVEVIDCSADGRVLCGRSINQFLQTDGWIWTAAQGFTSLGPNPIGNQPPWPSAISDDGVTVVGRLVSSAVIAEGFRWTPLGGIEVLDRFPGAPSSGGAFAFACDGTGARVGGSITSGVQGLPAIWDAAGVPAALPLLPTTDGGFAEDMSRDGVVVGLQLDAGNPRGFRWDPVGGLVSLTASTGNPLSVAQAISRDGRITFGAYAVGTSEQFVRWDELGTPELLDGLPPGTVGIDVVAVDEHGRTAVGRYFTPGGPQGFHWSESDGVRTLEELAADCGVTLPAGGILDPAGMSADGNVIAGNRRGTGLEGFVLTLKAPAPAEIGVDVCDPSVPNSTGASPLLRAFGSTDPAANDVVLFAAELPRQTFGIVAVSRTTGFQPGVGGGQGTLCLGTPLGRYAGPGQVQSTGALGRMSFRMDTSAIPEGAASVAVQPGESWTFQFWHRDIVQGAATSNLTAARTVTFQ